MKLGVKRILLATASVVFLLFPVFRTTVFAADTAVPTAANILVDGVLTPFDAYNIGGNNYFKLRDMAYALNGGAKQFDVAWDAAAGTILLKTGAAYTPVGGEMSAGNGEAKTLTPANVKAQTDGAPVALSAYNIGGYNYCKLRDIGKTLHFGVRWDAATKSVTITTDTDYVEEGIISYMKSFGVYNTASDWFEAAELSQNDRYYYLKNGQSPGKTVSNISVESGRHRYASADYSLFRDAVYRGFLKQVSNDPDAGFLFGDSTTTAKGYTLYIFTIEYEGVGRTDRMYYIVDDYKYVLITETDLHDKSVADITTVAKTMADSFEWPH
ncbi:MAG: copper amine oxidase N-terminal domain-containing protein [Clostridiales Family XIII bacterium]|jgi:hypothetical protein|nr:copper amine oxidase N-terminal domain-containing protein [Clostridiales Family XIII bacterium]